MYIFKNIVVLYSTLYCTMYIVNCTVYYTLYCNYTVQCTVHYTIQCTVHYTVQCSVHYTVHCTVHYTVLYIVRCTVYCSLYILQCTVQCTVHCNVHCTLWQHKYNVYCPAFLPCSTFLLSLTCFFPCCSFSYDVPLESPPLPLHFLFRFYFSALFAEDFAYPIMLI